MANLTELQVAKSDPDLKRTARYTKPYSHAIPLSKKSQGHDAGASPQVRGACVPSIAREGVMRVLEEVTKGEKKSSRKISAPAAAIPDDLALVRAREY